MLPIFQNLNYKLQRRLSDVLPIQHSHQSDSKRFLAIGGLHGDKLCDILQAMTPTSVETVRQTSLFHIESNPDRLELLSPTNGQRSQQQSGQITLQSVLINKPKFLKATHHAENCDIEIPRSIVAEALSWWSRRTSQHSDVQSPVHSWKTPQLSCPFAVPCWSS